MKITRKHFLRSLAGIAGAGFCFPHPAPSVRGGSAPSVRGGSAPSVRGGSAPSAVKAGSLAMKDLGKKPGLRITSLGMGATRTMEPALIHAAVDQGINFLDTGRSYMNGRNEEMLGRALQGKRQKVIIQSKIGLPEDFPGTVTAGQAGALLESELGKCLKALRTDYVDVMLLHGIEAEPLLDHETVLDFFFRSKLAGKIRLMGFSAHRNHVALLEKAVRTANYDVVLLPFNPFGRFRHSIGGWTTDWDQERLVKVMGLAQAAGIGVVAMKTCSAGPYALREGDAPSLAGAVRWVTDNPCIAGAVPAIANFTQLEEHLSRHRT
jgi:aryl-alcohol dehydrogenase-like predicted oxidoreductase